MAGDFEQDWAARQEKAAFRGAALKEAQRERAFVGPVSDSVTQNTIEIAFTSAAHSQSTAALLKGEDEIYALQTDYEEVYEAELRKVADYEPEVLIGFGPSPGGLMKWLLRFVGISYVLDKVGLPTPVMDLLSMAGESFGFEAVFGNLPFLGEPKVAVYYKSRLLGVMDLSSWADFRSSMVRVVWAQMRTRMEG